MSSVEHSVLDGPSAPPLGGIDYLKILWEQRRVILSIICIFVALAILARLVLPPRYKETVVMVPTSATSDASRGVMGTLANLGLLGTPQGPSETLVALATVQSRRFLQDFVTKENMLPVIFADQWNAQTKQWRDKQPTLEQAYKALHGALSVDNSSSDDTVRVGISWNNDNTAAFLANRIVARLNAEFQTQAVASANEMITYLSQAYDHTTVEQVRSSIVNLIQEQIKTRILAQSRPDYVMKVIDPAVAGKNRTSPGLSILLPLALLLGGFFGASTAFIRHTLTAQGRDPLQGFSDVVRRRWSHS